MRCDEAAPLLEQHGGGPVSMDLEDHLHECGMCSAQWQRERTLAALLRSDYASNWSPPDLRLLIGRRVAAEQKRLARWKGARVALACAVLGIGASLFTLRSSPLAERYRVTVSIHSAMPATVLYSHRTSRAWPGVLWSHRDGVGLLADAGPGVVADLEQDLPILSLKGGEQRPNWLPADGGLLAS